jgi:hypothetical protein
VDPDQIANQIRYGSSSTDIHINGGDFLGPIIPGSVSLTLAADDETPIAGQAQAIANALNDVATGTVTNDRRRIFPLYSTYSSANEEAVLVGFVAGTILPAPATQYDAGDQRLKIAIEPEFVIHFTAVTARTFTVGMTNSINSACRVKATADQRVDSVCND